MFISGPDFPAAFIASEYFLPYVLFVGIFPSVFWQLCFYFSCLGWILSAFSFSTKGHWFWALLFPSYLTKGCQIALRLTHNDISLNSCFSSPHILNSICLPSLCYLVQLTKIQLLWIFLWLCCPSMSTDTSPSSQLLLEVSVFPFMGGFSLKPYRCSLLHI